MEDIIHMTKTNLKANHIRIENLYKSMFSEIKNTSIDLRDDKVEITHLNEQNQDPAILNFLKLNLAILLVIGMAILYQKLKNLVI